MIYQHARRAALALVVSALLGGCRAEPPPTLPSVVVISIDTLRADHLGCYGNREISTPHIDQFANEAHLFENVVASAPTTLASHTSLMTGTYPHTHGAPRNSFKVPTSNLMLAEILREEGLETAGFVATYALSSRFDFAQGFDHYDDEGFSYRGGESVNESVGAWLEDYDGTPVFLFVHYWDAHYPYMPPPPFDSMYRSDKTEITGARSDLQETRRLLRRGQAAPDRNAALKALYAGGVSHADSHVGALLDLLREHGLYESSLILLTSDHGEAMDEHWEFWDHGASTYRTSTHIPLIMRLPGGAGPGTRIERLTSNVDITPTVLEFLGLPLLESFEGRSFAPLLMGATLPPRRPVFSEATKPHGEEYESGPWVNSLKMRSIRDARWKLAHRPLEGVRELYDLESDPHEQSNLLESPNEEERKRAEAMGLLLDSWSTRAGSQAGSHDVSEETLRVLESLGYVEGN